MQHIQDKEFDQLMKEKLDGMAVEPSAGLWAAIEKKIEPQRKKNLPVYWMAAAVAVVALSMTLLFNKSEKIRLYAPELAGNKDKVASVIPGAKTAVDIENAKLTADHVVEIKRLIKAKKADRREENIEVVHPHQEKNILTMQPSEEFAHPDDKILTVKMEKAELPEMSEAKREMIANAADNDIVNDSVVKGEAERENHRGIRNMGDLINYVVEKVDKREEKFIQFKTEDDNSSLVALNIGILKFNRKKQK